MKVKKKERQREKEIEKERINIILAPETDGKEQLQWKAKRHSQHSFRFIDFASTKIPGAPLKQKTFDWTWYCCSYLSLKSVKKNKKSITHEKLPNEYKNGWLWLFQFKKLSYFTAINATNKNSTGEEKIHYKRIEISASKLDSSLCGFSHTRQMTLSWRLSLLRHPSNTSNTLSVWAEPNAPVLTSSKEPVVIRGISISYLVFIL